jgi:hypothetical protein
MIMSVSILLAIQIIWFFRDVNLAKLIKIQWLYHYYRRANLDNYTCRLKLGDDLPDSIRTFVLSSRMQASFIPKKIPQNSSLEKIDITSNAVTIAQNSYKERSIF